MILSEICRKIENKFADPNIIPIFAILFREHSSVGLEHLPYKQRVGGSTPSAPTKALDSSKAFFFVYFEGYFVRGKILLTTLVTCLETGKI